MTSTNTQTDMPIGGSPLPTAGEMKLEVIVLPVSDVDRAKRFYQNLGRRSDADLVISPEFRVVQSRHRVHKLQFASASALRRPRRVRR